MGTKNPRQAASQAESFSKRAMRGNARHKSRYNSKARTAGDAIYRKYQVGPSKWQAKHLQYFFNNYLENLSNPTKYEYWQAVKAVLVGLNRYDDLEQHLQGHWRSPKGRTVEKNTGRKPKLQR